MKAAKHCNWLFYCSNIVIFVGEYLVFVNDFIEIPNYQFYMVAKATHPLIMRVIRFVSVSKRQGKEHTC